jgi:hypothetical protein
MMFSWTSLSPSSSASFPITIRDFLLPSCIHQQPNKPTCTSFCWSFVLKFRMFTLIFLIWSTFLFVRSFVKSATLLQLVCWCTNRSHAKSLLIVLAQSCNKKLIIAVHSFDFMQSPWCTCRWFLRLLPRCWR